MPDNVVHIGEYRVRSLAQPKDRCRHTALCLHTSRQVVICDDCGAEVSAFAILTGMTTAYRNALAALAEKVGELKAAQDVVARIHEPLDQSDRPHD